METRAYLKISVEGIQKYICSTGKLKEMIGGSEIIYYLTSENFYWPILQGLNLEEDREFSGKPNSYIVAQNNAGSLCLIVPNQELAADFLEKASTTLLADFPGLPFYGAVTEFAWSDDLAGGNAYDEARRQADTIITAARDAATTPEGSGLLPILRAARLDGLPAVARLDGELVSLPSAARRDPAMLQMSRERLQKEVTPPGDMRLEWKDNLEELLGGEGGKVALICMDGNDFGKLFGSLREQSANRTLCQRLRSRREFSEHVATYNRIAFNHACNRIANYEAAHKKGMDPTIVMPLRPIVMGGDDITIIVRADLALLFVETFTRKFTEVAGKDNLSLGIGMVVMDASYPFAKAFPLAETLQDSAKNLTRDMKPRPSSIDYLVLTEDVENDIDAVRQRLFTCPGGEILTAKPFILKDGSFASFLQKGCAVLALPRSQVREAWTVCRQGSKMAERNWHNLQDNIKRGIGGRHGKLMHEAAFKSIFPENFFITDADTGREYTSLGDYLELERLLPGNEKSRQALLSAMSISSRTEEKANV